MKALADDAMNNPNEKFIMKWAKNRSKISKANKQKTKVVIKTVSWMVLRFLSFERFNEFKLMRLTAPRTFFSNTCRMVRIIPKKAFYGMSATPTLNSIQDIVGIVSICRFVALMPFKLDDAMIPTQEGALRAWAPLDNPEV
ncbi:hypothetical protein PFICI_12212 [Pestalotiopsis fici W106-1]|uniref:Uncharacterized protein n=1 Tax=Pestalotiopsis fici (strain W106-1 / CGMCC3.15140) TaxID=1229662 RepID=W3WSI9_PESFW|nr:uncharacterized protein PFICI_12212 [Pestalotiopsis fici W106-1]ETS76825.1 hypothetical protein PFICI_12212 [Pestalotiopsis fici W106-1]